MLHHEIFLKGVQNKLCTMNSEIKDQNLASDQVMASIYHAWGGGGTKSTRRPHRQGKRYQAKNDVDSNNDKISDTCDDSSLIFQQETSAEQANHDHQFSIADMLTSGHGDPLMTAVMHQWQTTPKNQKSIESIAAEEPNDLTFEFHFHGDPLFDSMLKHDKLHPTKTT